jgi:hypothetical protein
MTKVDHFFVFVLFLAILAGIIFLILFAVFIQVCLECNIDPFCWPFN